MQVQTEGQGEAGLGCTEHQGRLREQPHRTQECVDTHSVELPRSEPFILIENFSLELV